MDLSSFGDTRKFRKRLTSQCPAMIGTVPIYDAVVYYHKPLKEINSEELDSDCGNACVRRSGFHDHSRGHQQADGSSF